MRQWLRAPLRSGQRTCCTYVCIARRFSLSLSRSARGLCGARRQVGAPRLPLGTYESSLRALVWRRHRCWSPVGRMANPGDGKTLQRWVMEELAILNIKRHVLATLRSEIDHVALALQPFDSKSWVANVGGTCVRPSSPCQLCCGSHSTTCVSSTCRFARSW